MVSEVKQMEWSLTVDTNNMFTWILWFALSPVQTFRNIYKIVFLLDENEQF